MNKRGGSRPKGEYVGKSQVFSTRIRPDLRSRLEQASKKSGRSLSQEIEHRLRRSFVEDDKIAERFGGRRNYWVMKIIALALEGADAGFHTKNGNWLDDPVSFDRALGTIRAWLMMIRPPGDGLPHGSWEPSVAAVNLRHEIETADPSRPITAGTKREHLMGIMKTEVGDLISRNRKAYSTKKAEP